MCRNKSIALLEFVIPRVINGESLAAQFLKAEEKKQIFIEAEYNGSIAWAVWIVPLVGEQWPWSCDKSSCSIEGDVV